MYYLPWYIFNIIMSEWWMCHVKTRAIWIYVCIYYYYIYKYICIYIQWNLCIKLNVIFQKMFCK